MTKPQHFDRKKADSLELIASWQRASQAPVVLSSFGKESLCLLALADQMNVCLPVAYFEMGVNTTAHRFARQFIMRYTAPVTILRPHRTIVASGRHGADIGYEFDLASGDKFQIVGATFNDTEPGRVSCGLTKNLDRSARHAPYRWDLLISGRRASDIDPTVGVLHVDSPVAEMKHGTRVIMPLLRWTDEDLTHYLLNESRWKPDPDRYDVVGESFVARPDNRANPDWLAVCIRCLTNNTGEKVDCPLDLTPDTTRSLSNRVHYESGDVPPTVMF